MKIWLTGVINIITIPTSAFSSAHDCIISFCHRYTLHIIMLFRRREKKINFFFYSSKRRHKSTYIILFYRVVIQIFLTVPRSIHINFLSPGEEKMKIIIIKIHGHSVKTCLTVCTPDLISPRY